MKNSSPGSRNIEQLVVAAGALGDLVNEVVFVGGCTTGLLVDEVARPEARATEDVDVIVDVLTQAKYHEFGSRLKARGFTESTGDDALICRWYSQSAGGRLVLDVMPTDPKILGFSNPWYGIAVREYEWHTLPNGVGIKVVRPLVFLATKFAAWAGRGRGDIYHKDVEDIVYVLENRPRIAVEFVSESQAELKAYLQEQSANLWNHSNFLDHLPGMVSHSGGEDAVVNALELMARE